LDIPAGVGDWAFRTVWVRDGPDIPNPFGYEPAIVEVAGCVSTAQIIRWNVPRCQACNDYRLSKMVSK